MFAGDWFEDHAEPAAARSRHLPAGGEPVRVLLYEECRTAGPRPMSECEGAIRVVGTASSSREVVDRMASLQPDVLVMKTEGDTATADFRATVLALSEARLADRAVLMVSHLASYLGLATKAGAAGLLPVGAPDDVVARVLREIRTRLAETTPVGSPGTTGEPADPRWGGGKM